MWKDRSYAIPFAATQNGISSWLYPTRLGPEVNLKMRLMKEPASERIRDLVACYLAGVIKHSRSWFEANGPADYRRRDVKWSINLGFPGKRVDRGQLTEAYRSAARVAVALACQTDEPTLERAREIRLRESGVASACQIELYPEIAAQLAGYVNSPFRQPGNLVLVDVGAGTLDVSTIILHSHTDQDVVSFHVCEVVELGALHLYETRFRALEQTVPGSSRQQMEFYQDGNRPIPEQLEQMVQTNQLHRAELKLAFSNASKRFGGEVLNSCWSCLARFRKVLKEKHTSPSYDPWGSNLRFFITGGGSRVSFYRQLLIQGPLEERLTPWTRWHPDPNRRRELGEGLLVDSLPLPDENFKNFPPHLRSDFDRLSVAYGLAFGGQNLMKVTAATHH